MAKQDEYLVAFAALDGHVSSACQAVGIHRTTPFRWSKTDRSFRTRYENTRKKLAELAAKEIASAR